MNSKLIRLVVIIGAAGVAWLFNDPSSDASTGDQVVEFAPGDVVMNAAQDEARRMLPNFFDAALDTSGESRPDTLVKVAFDIDDPKNPDNGVEVIWVGPFARDDDGFSGVLANEPVSMPGFQLGSTVIFDEDMIRDWILPAGDGRSYGHYTTRVIAAQSNDDQFKAMIGQILMPEPVPASW